jgi:thiol:disulfide interchange protein DsbA
MLQRFLLLVTLLLAAPLALAQDFVEGRDFFPISPAARATSGDAIEVVEVFGYPCIHCAHAAPVIAKWKQSAPSDVKLTYVPAVFGGVWEAYARAFYTAETTGVLERSHDKLFEVIHTERRAINNLDGIAGFYTEYGVDKETFLGTMTSFPVDAKIAESQRLVQAWGVEGTPTMIVAGKYRVMSQGGDQGFEKMMQIVDFLIAKERAATKSG